MTKKQQSNTTKLKEAITICEAVYAIAKDEFDTLNSAALEAGKIYKPQADELRKLDNLMLNTATAIDALDYLTNNDLPIKIDGVEL